VDAVHLERPVRHLALAGWLRGLGDTVERLFTIAALLALTGGLSLLRNPERDSVDLAVGDPTARLIYGGIYLAIAGFLVIRIPRVWRIFMSQKLLIGLLVLGVISVTWSYHPEITARRGTAAIGTSLVGLYLASRYSSGDELRLLAWALSLAALLSLSTAILLPAYGIDSEGQATAWRGIFRTKQGLGKHMLLATIVLFFVARRATRWKGVIWGAMLLTALLTILSTSKTPIVVAMALAAMWPLASLGIARSPLVLAALTAVIAVLATAAVVVFAEREAVVAALGKDLTLTGRTYIWLAALESGRDHSWIGHGLGGFWTGWSGPSATVWRQVGWEAPHSHNGFIDLWLELGIIGLTLFVVIFFRFAHQAMQYFRRSTKAGSGWPMVFAGYFFLFNIPGSSILEANGILWVIFSALVFRVSAGGMDPATQPFYSSRVTGRRGGYLAPVTNRTASRRAAE
jgi:exopolysaccharide production protein ExoQ